MPQLFHSAGEPADRQSATDFPPVPKHKPFPRFSFPKFWPRKDDRESVGQEAQKSHDAPSDASFGQPDQAKRPGSRQGLLNRRPSRKVVPGLPRPITFRRQNSERRERLMPVQPCAAERRAVSVDRRGGDHGARRAMSPPPMNMPSLSAPEVGRSECEDAELTEMERIAEESLPNDDEQRYPDQRTMDQEGEPPPAQATPLAASGVDPIDPEDSCSEVDDGALQVEADAKWILNLSMHFRDKSDREKFFITYAEEPNKWRRVTVSLDYRDAPPESLEADLKGLHFQRDKSFHIYESIRDSLADIQFYDTVTNLKLVTTPDGRLHVHVTEDINEVIPYPPTNSISHLDCRHFKESDVVFDSHISGFVYKVKAGGVTCIKKEIPGPDSVEEFLYEINALRTLGGSKAVINFEGVIVDDQARYVKGLLISYADRGALVDLLYDLRGTNELPWTLRERWARQIIEGLSEIHESGFVQGDFTLSNIVINSKDEAKIIDINRRGCPVGWEPPEMDPLIDSGQRVSIYIGVKSDLYQLGMVLWAIAAQEDEPERQDRTELLQVQTDERFAEIPQYYKDIVAHCLSRDPRNRLQAKELLKLMDDATGAAPADHAAVPLIDSRHSVSTHHSEKKYIDPLLAVDHDDISRSRQGQPPPEPSVGDASYINRAPSTDYQYDSTGSYVLADSRRTQQQPRQREDLPYPRAISTISVAESELPELVPTDASREPQWEHVYVDGNTARLVQRGSFRIDNHDFAAPDQTDDVECLSASDTCEGSDGAAAFPKNVAANIAGPDTVAAQAKPAGNSSFHNRAQRCRLRDSTLADLEMEVSKDINPSQHHRRASATAQNPDEFPPPKHHDSGFDEPQSSIAPPIFVEGAPDPAPLAKAPEQTPASSSQSFVRQPVNLPNIISERSAAYAAPSHNSLAEPKSPKPSRSAQAFPAPRPATPKRSSKSYDALAGVGGGFGGFLPAATAPAVQEDRVAATGILGVADGNKRTPPREARAKGLREKE